MKRTSLCLSFAAVLALAVSNLGFAADQTGRANPYIQPLSQVKAPELPAQCASLVSKASVEDSESVTVDVVSACAKINSPAVPAVVGAISKARPTMAALAASTAVGLQPKQAAAIVRAAVGAAPDQAGAIVYSVCVRNPGSYRMVASVAADLAPQQKASILESVASAIPSQKPFIQQAQAGGAADRSVTSVLEDASRLSAQSGQVAAGSETVAIANSAPVRGYTVGPPYQPLGGTPGNSGPGTSTNVPPGERDYTAP
jgi:hypothetical protein